MTHVQQSCFHTLSAGQMVFPVEVLPFHKQFGSHSNINMAHLYYTQVMYRVAVQCCVAILCWYSVAVYHYFLPITNAVLVACVLHDVCAKHLLCSLLPQIAMAHINQILSQNSWWYSLLSACTIIIEEIMAIATFLGTTHKDTIV